MESAAVRDDPRSKQEYLNIRRKIHNQIGNPGMSPGCPLTTTDRTTRTLFDYRSAWVPKGFIAVVQLTPQRLL